MEISFFVKLIFVQQVTLHHWTDGNKTSLPVVDQPAIIRTEAGASMTINCAFAMDDHLYSVSWTLGCEGNISLEKSPCYQHRVIYQDLRRQITIINLTESDSGTYCCHVEVVNKPRLSGNGTRLEVSPRACPSDCRCRTQNLWLTIEILRIISLVVLIILVCVLIKLSV